MSPNHLPLRVAIWIGAAALILPFRALGQAIIVGSASDQLLSRD